MFMKSIHKIIIILLCAAAIAGCKKSFLDRPSNSQISSNNFYKTTSDLRLATASLYGGASGGNGTMGLDTTWRRIERHWQLSV
jgi:hypothetical protein